MTDSWRRCCRAGRMVLLVAVVGSGLSQRATADQALDLYNLAVGAYGQERWSIAAEYFGKFATEYPQHPKVETARYFQGIALTEAKDFKAARPVWRKYAQDYPTSKQRPISLYRIAESSYMLNDLAAAETEFETFLQKHKEHALAEWALPFLAETEFYLKKPAEAAAHYEQSITDFPKGAMVVDARFGLGRALEALQRFDEAAVKYREVAADTKDRLAPQAQLNLATLDFDRGRFADSADAYEKFEQRFPKSDLLPTARLNAGYAWFQVGDYRKAIAKFTAAAETPAQAVTAGYWRGLALKALGEYPEAATVFAATFAKASGDPLAESLRFQQADCRLRNREYSTARDLFLEVEKSWPQGRYAAQALHFAAEATLLLARQSADADAKTSALLQAGALTTRFEQEHPKHELRPRHDLLVGRIFVQRGGAENLRQAATRFQAVLDAAKDESIKLLASFHLAQTLQKQGRDAEVVKVAVPVIAEVSRTGATSEYLGALVIAGNSHLVLGNDDEVIRLTTQYLELAPKGDEADLALAARVVAHARRKEKEAVQLDLATLRDQYPGSPLVPQRMLQVAEVAYEAGDWNWAAEWFETVVKLGDKNPEYPAALSGLAWSRFEQEKYLEAAGDFKRFVAERPTDPLRSAEAAYMYGQALQKAGKTDEAAAAYEAAFKAYQPPQAVAAGAAEKGPLRYAFLSGLLAARMADQQGQPEQADKAYESLLSKFPAATDLDKLLDEWALMNLRAKRYQRSDEVFARLVKDCPDSDLRDNAEFSLAESAFIANRLDEAKTALTKLLSDPKTDKDVLERVRYQLMELAKEQQDWPAVITHSQALQADFAGSRYANTARFREAEALLLQGKTDDAQTLLLKLSADRAEPAVAAEPWFSRVWVLLAETYIRQKDYAKVESTVNEFAAADPKNNRLHEAYEILGRSYKNQAQWATARTAFEKTLADEHSRGTETAAKAQLMIAETWWHQQEYAKAQAAYLKVYLLHNYADWQAPALFQVAMCDEQLEQWQKAAKTYREVRESFPQSEFAGKAAERLKEIAPKLAG